MTSVTCSGRVLLEECVGSDAGAETMGHNPENLGREGFLEEVAPVLQAGRS